MKVFIIMSVFVISGTFICLYNLSGKRTTLWPKFIDEKWSYKEHAQEYTVSYLTVPLQAMNNHL